MSILKRFSDIMSSNINAILDKFEDPAKMVDQLLNNLEDDLNKVKSETAGVMADEMRGKRELDECTEEINKLFNYAQKAIKAGNDDDARQFLTKKAELVRKQETLQKSYDLAKVNAEKMRQMHDKLVEQIKELQGRRDEIKAKVSMAKAQERINKIGSSVENAGSNLDAFSKMEDKADRMLDRANAMQELNSSKNEDVDSLMDKYSSGSVDVEDELNALKSGMDNSIEEELSKLKEETNS
ncbi:MAG: PspA/IM30 family protein [Clostridiaceae bacterium]